jgi:hypothetical protein
MAGADTIVFDPTLFTGGPGTINLQAALATITDTVTITGPALVNNHPQLTVRRDAGASAGFRVFNIDGTNPVTVNISNLTITGGSLSGTGAGIQTSEEDILILDHVDVVNNNSGSSDGAGMAAACSWRIRPSRATLAWAGAAGSTSLAPLPAAG